MKTIYVTFFGAFLFAQNASAQITLLQRWHEPQAGEAGTRLYDSTANSNPIPRTTGGGQTWNFSGLSMNAAPAVTHSYVTAAAVPSASMFAGTTLVNNLGGNNYEYF